MIEQRSRKAVRRRAASGTACGIFDRAVEGVFCLDVQDFAAVLDVQQNVPVFGLRHRVEGVVQKVAEDYGYVGKFDIQGLWNVHAEYYHAAVAGAVVKPGNNKVLPVAPEIIRNSDGKEKQDSERAAGKRCHASDIFFLLNLLALQFHTILEYCDVEYQLTYSTFSVRIAFFEALRVLIRRRYFDSWVEFLQYVRGKDEGPV